MNSGEYHDGIGSANVAEELGDSEVAVVFAYLCLNWRGRETRVWIALNIDHGDIISHCLNLFRVWAPLPARNVGSKDVGDGGEEQAVTGWREVSHVIAFLLRQRDEASVGNHSPTPPVRDLRYMNKIEDIYFGNVDPMAPNTLPEGLIFLTFFQSMRGTPKPVSQRTRAPMQCSATRSRQALVPAAHGWRAVRPVVKLGGGTGQQETPPDNIFELVQD